MLFSLRLNETEAEALNRLAAISGTSKNKVLAGLIIKEYASYDGYVRNGRLYGMADSLYTLAMDDYHSLLHHEAFGNEVPFPAEPYKDEKTTVEKILQEVEAALLSSNQQERQADLEDARKDLADRLQKMEE